MLERQAGALPPGYEYRLPTEAEWEHACRAGTKGPHYGLLKEIAALPLNQGGVGAVGRFLPNDWGLHDMLGLVFEWCLDAYGRYHPTTTTDPLNRHRCRRQSSRVSWRVGLSPRVNIPQQRGGKSRPRTSVSHKEAKEQRALRI